MVAIAIGCCPSAQAQDGSKVGLLPSAMQRSALADSERNPFAKREEPKPEAPVVADDSESEESRIGAVLNGLSVVGRTRDASGWKVLLGNLILTNGKVLPPVIEGQTQTLRVAAIYDSAIEIEWIEKDPNDTPRRIFIPIRLEPTVGSALSGGSASQGEKAPPVVITRPPDDVRITADVPAYP